MSAFVYAEEVGQGDWGPQALLCLSTEESHHLVKVLRARVGQNVRVLDGKGTVWGAQLEDLGGNKKPASVRLLQKTVYAAPKPKIELIQAVAKPKALEALVLHGTELGLARLRLIKTQYSTSLGEAAQEVDLVRLRQIALQACKQSGNPFLPDIQLHSGGLSALEASQPVAGVRYRRWVASLGAGARSWAEVVREQGDCAPDLISWLIGPEGGFTPQEESIARAAGFEPVCLAPYTLRLQTAGWCALAVSTNAWGGVRAGLQATPL